MLLRLLKAKLHRATVTAARLDYEGSVTIDPFLLDATGIVPYEAVEVWNVANGERFNTYALAGRRGSAEIIVNGAAARRVQVGDKIIITAFAAVDATEARTWRPKIILLDEENRIRQIVAHASPAA